VSAAWAARRATAIGLRSPRRQARLSGVLIAGLTSVAANLCCLHLVLMLGGGVHLAWTAAFEIGTLVGFAAHQVVTWRDRLPLHAAVLGRRLARFQAGALAALLVNLTLFAALSRAGLPYLAADLAGIAAGFCFNTVVGLRYVFTR